MDTSAFDPKRVVQPVLRFVVLYLSIIVISLMTMVKLALASGTIPATILLPAYSYLTSVPAYSGLFVGQNSEAQICGVDPTIEGVGIKCAQLMNQAEQSFGIPIRYTYTGYMPNPANLNPANRLGVQDLLFTVTNTITNTVISINSYFVSVLTLGGSCPANSDPTPPNCTCNTSYVPDPTATSCVNSEQYTIALQNPLADVVPSGTTDAYTNTSSTVYAQVINAQTNQPKAGVQVKFSVDVVANTGGHDGNHYQMRPKGKLLDCGSGSEVETTVCITQQDGRATVTFNAPIVSGTHTVTAECVSPSCTGSASGDINVKVPGLEPMPYSTLYVFVGDETGKPHTDNHYLTSAASGKIQKLADFYHSRFPFSPVLRVNDASLVWGGVLDISGSWTVPHIQHRRGMVIDVRANQLPDAIPNSNDSAFQKMITRQMGGSFILENQDDPANRHYHIHLLGIKG